MKAADRVRWSLLLLRIGVAAVMIPWALDKLINPEHARAVFANFYGMAGLGSGLLYLIGAVQLAVVAGFLAGYARTWT